MFLSKAFIFVPVHVHDNRPGTFVSGLNDINDNIFSSDKTFQSSSFSFGQVVSYFIWPSVE